MKSPIVDEDFRLDLCWLGTLGAPFGIFGVYLWASRALKISSEAADGLFFVLSVAAGLAFIAWMPIRLRTRVVLACFYVPVVLWLLTVFGLFFVVVVCRETI